MVWGDAREAWDPGVIFDPRVKQFWDQEKLAGQWFAENVEGYQGIVWDAYYLYGPEAIWGEAPPPSLSSGGTIYGEGQQLEQALLPLLKPSS